ncbi:hypothetical protein MKZ17_07800 [Solibacillus sp. FSL R7-0682]|uniref:hypothetical protein n=1 Tax=Solibacillus sp. FSL R7-0682 TaxID=2921690 RepID=UPI0030F63718
MSFEQTLTIAIITAVISLLINSLLQILKKQSDNSINTKSFKRELANKKLEGLYLELYKLIIQSEYVRFFTRKYEKTNLDPIDYPFLSIGMSQKKIKIDSNGFKEEIEEIDNPITQVKMKLIIDKINDNPSYASTELLKLSIAYRYVHHYFVKDNLIKEEKDKFDEEELRLSRMIVMLIIQETNKLLEESEYFVDGKEVSKGLFNHSIFERDRI